MGYVVLFSYYAILTFAFYCMSYGDKMKKPFIELVGIVSMFVGLLLYTANVGITTDVNNNFSIGIGIIYILLVMPVRLIWENKLVERYCVKNFSESYTKLVDEFLHELTLFQNAVDVKKFKLSDRIKSLETYSDFLKSKDIMVAECGYMEGNYLKFQSEQLVKAQDVLIEANSLLRQFRKDLIMETSEDIVDDKIHQLANKFKNYKNIFDGKLYKAVMDTPGLET